VIEGLLSGETGFLVGYLAGMAVGIGLCRWLWVNGQLAKARLEAKRERVIPDG
jgi:hypothetical protein